MLQLDRIDGVDDPVETEDGIDDHGGIVGPHFFVAEGWAEETVFGVGVAETPVHDYVPDACGIMSDG